MRGLNFSRKWPKLSQPSFTTFRFPRKDKDWEFGERVRIVYKARTKKKEILGEAIIVNKEKRYLAGITSEEAIEDGFPKGKGQMQRWFMFVYDTVQIEKPLHKLTLKWVKEILKEENIEKV